MPLVNGVQYKLSHVRLLYQVSERTTWSSFFQGTDYVAKKNGNQWFRPIGLTTFKEILHAREALYLSILTISWQFTFPVADSSAIAFSDCLCGSSARWLSGYVAVLVAEWRSGAVGSDPGLAPAVVEQQLAAIPPYLQHRGDHQRWNTEIANMQVSQFLSFGRRRGEKWKKRGRTKWQVSRSCGEGVKGLWCESFMF